MIQQKLATFLRLQINYIKDTVSERGRSWKHISFKSRMVIIRMVYPESTFNLWFI